MQAPGRIDELLVVELEEIGVALALVLLHPQIDFIAGDNFSNVFHDELPGNQVHVIAQSPATPVARTEDAVVTRRGEDGQGRVVRVTPRDAARSTHRSKQDAPRNMRQASCATNTM